MNRVVIVIVALLIVVGGALAFLLSRSTPAPTPVAETAPAATPQPSAAPPPAPAPTPAPPTAANRPAARPAPRAATPAPAAAAAAPAATVPDPNLVTLKIDSDVPGAQVFIDRNFLGTTPLETTDVKAGPHRLNVSAPEFEGVARDVTLTPGVQSLTVKLREVRLDAAIDVVHRHRIGSCKGRLVATPQGIRYETTDKDDAFRAGLLDLETFEVNYLEKDLRIKPKQGKRYDFTDPMGNADKLFVFQRDVQKAIDRLKKGDPPAAAQE